MRIKLVGIAAIIFIVVIGAVFYVHLDTNNYEYSMYNSHWNGTSVLYSQLSALHYVPVRSVTILENHPPSVLLIIAPFRDYNPNSFVYYREFLNAGNTIILADDFGTGNQLLQGIQSTIQIDPLPLHSTDSDYGNKKVFTVWKVADSPYLSGVSSAILNRPSSLNGGETLMQASVFSWRDRDGDGVKSENESFAPYAVMAHEKIGQGDLVVVADSSIFINAMLQLDTKRDNAILVQNFLHDGRPILVDMTNSRTAVTRRPIEQITDLFPSPG